MARTVDRIRDKKGRKSPQEPAKEAEGTKGGFSPGAMVWYTALFVALITFVVFLPSLKNDFVDYDDQNFVVKNRHIISMDSDFIKWAFTDREHQWTPLRWVSHAADYKIWRLNPAGHHLSSVILHSLNAFLVVILVVRLFEGVKLRMLPPPAGEEEANERRKALIAGVITGLLFGIHPLRVESVAWVAERKDVLFAFFFLLSLLSYLHYCIFSENRRRPFYYSLTLVFFMMAVMSKAAAVVFPLVLILLDFYPLERVTFRSGVRTWRGIFIEKLPFAVISGIVSLINIGVHEKMGAVVPLTAVPFNDRVLLAFKAMAFYLMKMVWPFNLSLIYGEPYEVSLSAPDYIISLLFMTAMTASCFFLWHKGKRLWLAVWIYYIVMLLPVSVVKVFSFSFAHDRYTYMASIGPFLIAGIGVAVAMERIKAKNRLIPFLLPAVVLFLMAALTIKQTGVWKNSITLWNSVVERTPRFIGAYVHRGNAYFTLGKYREAIRDFDHVIEAIPGNEEVYNNRGSAYREIGDYETAIRDFSKAIELKPGYAAAYNNRAEVYARTGNYGKALADLEKTLTGEPNYVVSRVNLCAVKNLMRDYQGAIKECSTAIELDPNSASAYKHRGFSYNALGSYKVAIRDYDRSVGLNSKDYETYHLRGIASRNSGDPSAALRDFTRVVDLNPRFNVYNDRGITYGELGELENAIKDFTVAIRLAPDDAAAYYNRGAAYYRLKKKEEAMSDFQKAARLGDKQVQKILRERGIRW